MPFTPLAPQQASGGGFTPLGASQPPQTGPAPANPAGGIVNDIVHAIPDQIKSGVDQIKQGLSGSPDHSLVSEAENGLRVASGAASVLTSPFAPLFFPVKTAVNAVADKVSDIPAVQKFAQSDAGKTTARIAEDTSNAANVASTIGGAIKAPDAAATVADKAGEIATKLTDTSSPTYGVDTTGIVNNFTKAVKPTTAGKTGPGQLDAYNGSVVSAVKSIAANRDALSYDDGAGNLTHGELPTSRAEFADAIEQTKQAIFQQYNSLSKDATGQGVQISLEPAAKALQDVIDSDALQLSHPEAVAYAKGLQQRFQNPDGTWKSVDPSTAEQVIANYNADLKAFYKNPTFGQASRAAIDAGVVHELRQSVGDAIENATGENYAALKRSYGALSAIERDVNKAALTQLKQTGTIPSGIGKYVDTFSTGDMVSGLMSLNPALFAKGAAQSALTHFWAHFNSPDRAVVNMFKAAEKGR